MAECIIYKKSLQIHTHHQQLLLLLLFPTTSSSSFVLVVDLFDIVDRIRNGIRTGMRMHVHVSMVVSLLYHFSMQKLTRGAQLIPTHHHHQFLFLFLFYWITWVCEPLCSLFPYNHLQEVNNRFVSQSSSMMSNQWWYILCLLHDMIQIFDGNAQQIHKK